MGRRTGLAQDWSSWTRPLLDSEDVGLVATASGHVALEPDAEVVE